MDSKPGPMHRWLMQLVGEWDYENKMECSGTPEQIYRGHESVGALGGLWVLAEAVGPMPDGQPASMLITLGFDSETQRFVGTWIGTMMSRMWVYDGELGSEGRVLTLHSHGPAMPPGEGSTDYKDVIELLGPDQRRMVSWYKDPAGEWKLLMTINYQRVASRSAEQS